MSHILKRVDKTKKYVKILAEDLIHHDFEYELGLNEDFEVFDPSDVGNSKGLYFTTIDQIYDYLEYGVNIADVTIPDDALTRQQNGLYKANKIIISNIRRWDTELDHVKAVTINADNIKSIENPSEEVQLIAVQQDGDTIQYIENPSEEVQLSAVRQKGSSIRYIKNPSEEVQLAAIEQNYVGFRYIENPSEEAMLKVVQINGFYIKYCIDPSIAVQLAAVQNTASAITLIENPSKEVQIAAIEGYVPAYYIKNPTEKTKQLIAKREQIIPDVVYDYTKMIVALCKRAKRD
jgi:hypothetical protein